jgi:hypothetical protein
MVVLLSGRVDRAGVDPGGDVRPGGTPSTVADGPYADLGETWIALLGDEPWTVSYGDG